MPSLGLSGRTDTRHDAVQRIMATEMLAAAIRQNRMDVDRHIDPSLAHAGIAVDRRASAGRRSTLAPASALCLPIISTGRGS
ncbi:hypothetical protein P7L64_05150 [Tistrella bauzanensis]|uniref:hypothetical protein n=1 Tax=Tistrella bauzanensis TaxID=657419 RepID=UPI003557479A